MGTEPPALTHRGSFSGPFTRSADSPATQSLTSIREARSLARSAGWRMMPVREAHHGGLAEGTADLVIRWTVRHPGLPARARRGLRLFAPLVRPPRGCACTIVALHWRGQS